MMEPWLYELDELRWIDRETGLQCMLKRSRLGTLNGYVASPKHIPDDELEVHGGVTFSGILPDFEYCIGFDTAHAGDYTPGLPTLNGPKEYKNMLYVIREVTCLAAQIQEKTKWR